MSLNRTRIDWPELAYSWNPIVGCTNNCSMVTTGYDCYARRLNERFKFIPNWDQPVFYPERLREPGRFKKPFTIFVGSMCDIFSKGTGATWVKQIIQSVRDCPQHTFMFLSKLPQFYALYDWPGNCWLGTTVESKDKTKRLLWITSEKNKSFVSIEPILSDFAGVAFDNIDLIIIGADTSPGGKIPPLEWVKSIDHNNIWHKENIRKYYPQLANIKSDEKTSNESIRTNYFI